MRTLAVVVVLVAGFARAALADVVELSVSGRDITAALPGLVEQHDEPVGLLALQDNAALGLAKGDLVRAINGQPATRLSMLTGGGAIFYLDVARGAQSRVVRVAVKLDAAEDSISRYRYKDRVQQLVRFRDLVTNKNHVFTQVTNGGAPSGVMVPSAWFGFGTMVEGDVIRKVDGVDVATIDQAVEAFDRGKDKGEISITLERLGQTVVKTLRIEDNLDPSVANADDEPADEEPPPVTTRRSPIAMSLSGYTSAKPMRALVMPTARRPETAFAAELGMHLGSR